MVEARGLEEGDRAWARTQLERAWGSVHVARLGELIDASALPALVAWDGDRRVGVVTYAIRGGECEVVSISTDPQGSGAGRALMGAVTDEARRAGCTRLWLTTTDNNRRARAFYERWGMRVARVHHDGVKASRTVKPSIPEAAVDEIEYELRLV